MSKKKELQAKRDELQKHSLETVERLNELDLEIEAMIAEESKPKPRHGDYGFDSYSEKYAPADPRIYLRGHHYGCNGGDCDRTPLEFIKGNIFDDIKKMKK